MHRTRLHRIRSSYPSVGEIWRFQTFVRAAEECLPNSRFSRGRRSKSTPVNVNARTTERRKHPRLHNIKERAMSDPKDRTHPTSAEAKAAPAVDLKLEIVVIPVSDVDRAKQFYAKLGW